MITGINVTPLVDVVLVLLVVLMVTASYIVAHAIPMDLPAAATGEDSSATLAVAIQRTGALYLDGTPTTLAAIEAAARHAPAAKATIAADAATPHRDVVQVIDALRRGGLTHFALDVDPALLAREPR
jgi:biopolymer transport protein ExbD